MSDENPKKLLDCDDIWYSGIFGVADYESELKIQKLKMADLIYKNSNLV